MTTGARVLVITNPTSKVPHHPRLPSLEEWYRRGLPPCHDSLRHCSHPCWEHGPCKHTPRPILGITRAVPLWSCTSCTTPCNRIPVHYQTVTSERINFVNATSINASTWTTASHNGAMVRATLSDKGSTRALILPNHTPFLVVASK